MKLNLQSFWCRMGSHVHGGAKLTWQSRQQQTHARYWEKRTQHECPACGRPFWGAWWVDTAAVSGRKPQARYAVPIGGRKDESG